MQGWQSMGAHYHRKRLLQQTAETQYHGRLKRIHWQLWKAFTAHKSFARSQQVRQSLPARNFALQSVLAML